MLENKKLPYLTSTMLISLVSILFLSYGEGFNVPFYALAAFGLVLVTLTKWKHLRFDKSDLFIAATFLLYFFTSLFYMFYHGEGGGFSDKPGKIALSLFALCFIARFKPDREKVLISIALGAIVAAISAHTQLALELTNRAFDYKISHGFHSIQSGDIAMSLGVFSFISGLYFIKKYPNKNMTWLLFLFAALGGISASILSQSRGGWLFSPIIILLVYLFNRSHFKPKHNLSLVIGLLCLFTFHSETIVNRVESTSQDIEKSINSEPGTPTGIRLQLWEFSILVAAERPLTGYSKAERMELMDRYIAKGKVSNVIKGIDRAHNQFLEELVTKGGLGLVVFCSLFAVPLWLYWKNWKNQSDIDLLSHTYALLGIAHVLLTASYSLTQHFFTFSSGAIFYALYSVIFLCLSNSRCSDPPQQFRTPS